jgi:hypothetical protein
MMERFLFEFLVILEDHDYKIVDKEGEELTEEDLLGLMEFSRHPESRGRAREKMMQFRDKMMEYQGNTKMEDIKMVDRNLPKRERNNGKK